MASAVTVVDRRARFATAIVRFARGMVRDKYLFLMFLPALAYFIVFCYIPMYGVTLAFRDLDMSKGILNGPWVGLKHVQEFLSNSYSYVLIKNTLILRLWLLAFAFPCPIILAVLLNEIRQQRFKRLIQTSSYLPYFLSLVVVSGMVITFLASDGPINGVYAQLGGKATPWLQKPGWFRPIFVLSVIWQNTGWGSVLYLAALAAISPELYEAALVDGAGRWQRMRHITLPGILPVTTILFLLQIGQIVDVGYQRVLLLYNPGVYETADVLGTYIYRRGIESADFAFATAVGLCQALVGVIFLVVCNSIAKRVGDTSLW
jgi:putative aldouronate transport system permease protein